MQQIIKRPKWKTVEYSRSQIIKAGKTIKKDNIDEAEYNEATQIIDNWRASHAYPLHVVYMHLRRMTSGNNSIIVAQRLKRLSSILNKLKREPNMSLWTMQDLGGCRVIVPSVGEVYRCFEEYEKSRKRHMLVSSYDYIDNPKKSGYRSLHKVYRYHSDDNNSKYNQNMLIEIQFRTHLQHVWATAVETMGLFTKEDLKSGEGSRDTKRFFALVSSLFAIREKQNIVPDTSDDINVLISEIKELNAKHNYLEFLSGINVAVDAQERITRRETDKRAAPSYYILILNYNTRRLNIRRFSASQIEMANEIYNSIERTRAETKIDAVLVKVSSFETLKSAYPNYFSDISKFVNIVDYYINKY